MTSRSASGNPQKRHADIDLPTIPRYGSVRDELLAGVEGPEGFFTGVDDVHPISCAHASIARSDKIESSSRVGGDSLASPALARSLARVLRTTRSPTNRTAKIKGVSFTQTNEMRHETPGEGETPRTMHWGKV